MTTVSAPLARKKLPIGIQTFAKLREDDAHYYVDKTGYAVGLAQSGNCFFLSRPRRFGKSLFLDTIKQLFEGKRALFAGLQADARWDWTRTHPVIRISFAVSTDLVREAIDRLAPWFAIQPLRS